MFHTSTKIIKSLGDFVIYKFKTIKLSELYEKHMLVRLMIYW